MLIDTHSFETMKTSMKQYLNIDDGVLADFFRLAEKKCTQGIFCDGDILSNDIDEFIGNHVGASSIERVMFFHLSRRLNSANSDYSGTNLFDILTTKNALSNFLESHNISFIPNGKHLIILFNGKTVSIEDTFIDGVCYLRSRLGYNEGREDYCFNGFAFKDLLYKNSYARSLYEAPELIQQLSSFLHYPSLLNDFAENSRYYCLEYIVPLDIVLFDDIDDLPQTEKSKYFLNQVMTRLYEYATSDPRYLSDNANPILRLADDGTMKEEYFVDKEEITLDMLR